SVGVVEPAPRLNFLLLFVRSPPGLVAGRAFFVCAASLLFAQLAMRFDRPFQLARRAPVGLRALHAGGRLVVLVADARLGLAFRAECVGQVLERIAEALRDVTGAAFAAATDQCRDLAIGSSLG